MHSSAASKIDKIYVIHVKAFTDRAEHIRQELGKHGLDFEFILDYDVPEISAAIDQQYFDPCDLRMPAKSCCLKQIRALQKIAEHRYERCIIFEDDVFLADNFNQVLAAILQESSQRTSPHVVYLGNASNMYTPKSQLQPGQYLYPAKEGRAADSYLLGWREAEMRLGWIQQHKITLPADHLFNHIDRELGIQFLWAEPTIVEQGSHSGKFVTSLDQKVRHPLHQQLKWAWQKFRKKYLYRMFN